MHSPAWWVSQTAWEAAGGRTAGTTGTSKTSLGELPVGSGRIRILGSLLPDPSGDAAHPFGVSDYSDPAMKLTYAAKDARDFDRALKSQRGAYYVDVGTRVLTDREVTRSSIVDGLAWFIAEILPHEKVSRSLGPNSGLKGLLIGTAFGAILPGGPFTASGGERAAHGGC